MSSGCSMLCPKPIFQLVPTERFPATAQRRHPCVVAEDSIQVYGTCQDIFLHLLKSSTFHSATCRWHTVKCSKVDQYSCNQQKCRSVTQQVYEIAIIDRHQLLLLVERILPMPPPRGCWKECCAHSEVDESHACTMPASLPG